MPCIAPLSQQPPAAGWHNIPQLLPASTDALPCKTSKSPLPAKVNIKI